MDDRAAPGLTSETRRSFLGLTASALGLALGARVERAWGEPRDGARFEQLHRPVLRLPIVTNNGAKVPVVVELPHPMEPDHYVTSVQVVNPTDPVPSKGRFHFTPANGQAYVAFQVRVDDGVSEVSVTAECNRHGRFTTTESINIAEGAGGCASATTDSAGASGPASSGTGRRGRSDAADDIGPPRIRVPALVKGGLIKPGEIIDVQVSIKHPNRTGLVVRDGRFVQDSEPFHLVDLSMFYGPERVSRYTLTSALSDDPFITFRLRAQGGSPPLRVLASNNRGQRFEAVSEIPVS